MLVYVYVVHCHHTYVFELSKKKKPYVFELLRKKNCLMTTKSNSPYIIHVFKIANLGKYMWNQYRVFYYLFVM